MSEEILTQSRLKELLHYNPNTGIFINKVPRGGLIVGAICGYKREGNRGRINVVIQIDSIAYYAHRLAWMFIHGYMPDEIDHVDGDSLNNTLENLSNGTHQDNLKNQKKHITNTSGSTGVYWHKRIEKWQSAIYVSGKHIHLGYYENKNDAIIARKMAEKKHGFHVNHGSR